MQESDKKNNTVKDKVIIVTGASKGVGFGIVKSLLSLGAKVGMLSRNKNKLNEAVDALISSGFEAKNIFAIDTDISNKDSVYEGFSSVVKHFGRLDGLVNNAGVARPSA